MALNTSYRISIALSALIFFTFIFCLPNDNLPKNDIFSKIPFFDKWVHMGIFSSLIFIWSWALQLFETKLFIKLISIAAIYGLLIEVVQYLFIQGRSFDLTDLLADIVGCFIGLYFWKKWG